MKDEMEATGGSYDKNSRNSAGKPTRKEHFIK
jgi:hypothetical protein